MVPCTLHIVAWYSTHSIRNSKTYVAVNSALALVSGGCSMERRVLDEHSGQRGRWEAREEKRKQEKYARKLRMLDEYSAW